jgi:hypothetical protein
MFFLKKWYERRYERRVADYCRVHFQRLEHNDETFILGQGSFARKCHMVSIQAVKEGRARSVWLVLAWDNGSPFIHFLNKNGDGKWMDNSVGWEHKTYGYYLIREIVESEYEDIGNVLRSAQRFFQETFSNGFMLWLTGADIGI